MTDSENVDQPRREPAESANHADFTKNEAHKCPVRDSFNAPKAAIPPQLTALPQWVVWRKEKRREKETKIPYQAQYPNRNAKTDAPNTWSSFDHAVNACRNHANLDGTGFVFSESDPYCGIDLDNCLENDLAPKQWAAPIMADLTLVAYGEISPSKTGVKYWTRAVLPPDAKHRTPIGDGEIEIYDRTRYFTVTGYEGCGEIKDGQAVVDSIYETYFPKPKPEQAAPPITRRPTQSTQEITARIRRSKQKHKFDALMAGGITGGYNSGSEADQALCCLLAFWTRTPAQIDEIFRQSQLMRPKWDEKHAGDGRTYGQMTIDFALANTNQQVKPNARPGQGGKHETLYAQRGTSQLNRKHGLRRGKSRIARR